jgi:ABC-type glycerol-3-phosphate transport system substrate-binding protein
MQDNTTGTGCSAGGRHSGAMKRFLRIVLSTGLASLLTACSQIASERSSNVEAASSPTGSILVWITLPGFASASQVSRYNTIAQERVAGFNKLYPDVSVSYELIPADEIGERFIRGKRQGLGPDVAQVPLEIVSDLIQANSLKVLNPYHPDLSRFYAQLHRQMYVDSNLYAIPSFLDLRVLCYNTAKLAQPPATLAEMVSLARKGHSFGINSNFKSLSWTLGPFGIQLFAQQGRLMLPSAQELLPWFQWLQKTNSEPNMVFTDDTKVLFSAFIEGRLAAVTCPSSWIPLFRAKLGTKKLRVAVLPSGSKGEATPFADTLLWVFNQASSEQQTRLALRFVNFGTNAEQQKMVVLQYDAVLPTNRFATTPRGLYPIIDTLQTTAEMSVGIRLENQAIAQQLNEFVNQLYGQLIGGEITPDQAAQGLESFLHKSPVSQHP